MRDNYAPGDAITYYESYNTTESPYIIEEVFKSFIVCKHAKTGKAKQIYREFYKNIKPVLKAVK